MLISRYYETYQFWNFNNPLHYGFRTAGVFNLFMADGHTRNFGLVRKPHVKKINK